MLVITIPRRPLPAILRCLNAGVSMSSAPAVAANRNQNLSSAVREAEERYIAANPESQRLSQLAAQRLPGGNTRTTVHFSPFPLYMAAGKGGRLTDVDGHTYADFINEYTAGVFGHSNA